MKKILAVLIAAAIIAPYAGTSFSVNAEEVNIPAAAESDEKAVVPNVRPNTDTTVDDNKDSETDGDFEYIVLNNGTAEITGYIGNGGNIVIPDTVGGKSVTSIGEKAFYNCTSLESVILPDSLTRIGHYAFSHCKNLKSVSIPDNTKFIGGYAFCGCSALTDISIPDGITIIRQCTFADCLSIKNINIPKSVTSIEIAAFHTCTSLRSISIPENVTSIEYATFYGCTSLTNIIVPGNVSEIEDFAFSYCLGLKSISFLSGVTSIGNYSFAHCEALTSASVPDSMTSIGYYAFYEDENLTVYANTGSYAETYSSDNYIPFDKSENFIPDSTSDFDGSELATCIPEITIPKYDPSTDEEPIPDIKAPDDLDDDSDTPNDPYGVQVLLGDVNGDGSITPIDSFMARRAALGLDDLTPEGFAAADLDGDGIITAVEGLDIQRYSIELYTFNPVGTYITFSYK